jgi:hypothetical protein
MTLEEMYTDCEEMRRNISREYGVEDLMSSSQRICA